MPRLRALEIIGFRAFAEPQRLEFESELALVWAPNSQGKTSIAEAIEFLLTGRTARRELLGGAKAEFDAALRNAHLNRAAPVTVRAWICDEAGAEHEVCRTLTADYEGDQDCQSSLTIDGGAADDLSALGIELADPPLRGPVLLTHTLRFALSARPQERADYFKAVLEVTDLEHLRDLVATERDRCTITAPPPLAALRAACATVPALGDVRSAIERGPLERGAIDRELSRGADLGVAELGGVSTTGTLTAKLGALGTAVDARRERAFPLAAYRAGAVPEAPATDLAALGAYNSNLASVDAETERLRAVFEAILAVPSVSAAGEALTCPVCGTPEALTPRRVAELREQVNRSRGARQAQTAATALVTRLSGELNRLRQVSDAAVPHAAGLPVAEHTAHAEAAVRLLGTPDPHRRVLSAMGLLQAARDEVVAVADTALSRVRSAEEAVAQARPIDVEEIAATLAALGTQLVHLSATRTEYLAAAAELVEPLAAAADRAVGTGGWMRFAQVASDPGALREGLLQARAGQAVLDAMERAVEDLDRAKARVFDRKFEAMSAEIDRWWRLLRPDESVTFDSVRRRGSGRRYVTFKARLHPQVGVAGVERDALGVFSDSQLNALGLAAFLARCRRQGVPFIVLDDPVQAGDEEHRATFVGPVLEQLLADGVQVILLSYDDMTNRLIHDLYRDLPLDGFSASLDAPVRGVTVIKTANTAEALWQRAGACLISDVAEIREVAANKLRVAAERIAKEILVASRRSAGETCSLADYQGVTLGPLVSALEPVLTEPSHPGKWRVVCDLLNPGSHDDAPPSRADLRQARGYLGEFLRHYLAPARAVSAAS